MARVGMQVQAMWNEGPTWCLIPRHLELFRAQETDHENEIHRVIKKQETRNIQVDIV